MLVFPAQGDRLCGLLLACMTIRMTFLYRSKTYCELFLEASRRWNGANGTIDHHRLFRWQKRGIGSFTAIVLMST
ncbi:uncharacterized protein L203_103513 [Cryptococcus depauperatus CBS 7841]|uniref:Uncharacterized protein n=1 Tax=Cryptococcus depauperatus CBS 7841 TaxID=1295531 RepID=A0AAJ8JTP0_9TREE